MFAYDRASRETPDIIAVKQKEIVMKVIKLIDPPLISKNGMLVRYSLPGIFSGAVRTPRNGTIVPILTASKIETIIEANRVK